MAVARPQASLDVGDRHPVEKSDIGPDEGAGGVALHEHDVRLDLVNHFLQPRNRPAGELAE